jgi:hypothetical protein
MNKPDNGHILDRGGLQKLLITHMAYMFIASAMGVLVPLYMLERHIDIALIGVILSLGPLTFTVFRLLFAGIADDVGTKTISLIYSITNLVALEFYMLIISPLGFVAATLAEGLRTSGFWAIARTDVLAGNHIPEPGKVLAHFSNMRQLADGMGRLSIGFLLVFFAFSGSLAILLICSLSLVLLILSSSERGRVGFKVGSSTLHHIFKKRTAAFWKAALLQLLIWLPYNMLQAFLIPLYLISNLKLDYYEVGIILAMLSLATAGISIVFMRLRLSNRMLLGLTVIAVPALVLLPLLGQGGLILLILVAVSFGCSNIIGEYILVDAVFSSKDVSSDIGVIYIPLKMAEVLFLSLGGLVIATTGYAPLFFLLAVSIGLFVVLGKNAVLNAGIRPAAASVAVAGAPEGISDGGKAES